MYVSNSEFLLFRKREDESQYVSNFCFFDIEKSLSQEKCFILLFPVYVGSKPSASLFVYITDSYLLCFGGFSGIAVGDGSKNVIYFV